MNQNSFSKPENPWIAIGKDSQIMSTLCEHLPPQSVIVTTREQLQAQILAYGNSTKNIPILLDDSADLNALLPALETIAPRCSVIHLKTPLASDINLLVKSIQVLDKPIKISNLCRHIARQLSALENNDEMHICASCTLQLSLQRMTNPLANIHVQLTEKETQILAFLHDIYPNFAAREQLHREIWGYQGELNTHTLETHVYRLRSKFKEIGAEDIKIENTPQGYRIESAG